MSGRRAPYMMQGHDHAPVAPRGTEPSANMTPADRASDAILELLKNHGPETRQRVRDAAAGKPR
jgi:hypothetical protein